MNDLFTVYDKMTKKEQLENENSVAHKDVEKNLPKEDNFDSEENKAINEEVKENVSEDI